MGHRRRILVGPAMLVLACVAAACGGGSSTTKSGTPSTSATTTTTVARASTAPATTAAAPPSTAARATTAPSGVKATIKSSGTARGIALDGDVAAATLTCNPGTNAGQPQGSASFSGSIGKPSHVLGLNLRGRQGANSKDSAFALAYLVLDGKDDGLTWAGGTFTFADNLLSGTLDLQFGSAPHQVHLTGQFTCS